MKPSDFHAPETGRVMQTRTGYVAFVPAPLPPSMTYTAESTRVLSQADAARGELSGMGRLLPNPHLLGNSIKILLRVL